MRFSAWPGSAPTSSTTCWASPGREIEAAYDRFIEEVAPEFR